VAHHADERVHPTLARVVKVPARAKVLRDSAGLGVIKLIYHCPSVTAGLEAAMDISKIPRFDLKILDRPGITIRSVSAGGDIVVAGTPGNEMFLLRKGRARIHWNGRTLAEIGVGDVFGEMALVDKVPRDATVTAIDDCESIRIDERLFAVLVQESPYFALEVIRTLVARLRGMDMKV